jgi:hypothetical protein
LRAADSKADDKLKAKVDARLIEIVKENQNLIAGAGV